MCGIIGYKGYRNASDILVKGLKRLEYRGYDSWGIAVQTNSGKSFEIIKKVGKIGDYNSDLLPSHLGIAHTRWATHGMVNEINAHPHFSCDGRIALVHNGIIENYQELKKELISKKHTFTSETDSEVIVHLIEEYAKTTNIEKAIMKAVRQLRGSYALVITHLDDKMVFGVRKDSPLVVGIGNKEYFLASDVPAFLEWTRNAIFLDDDEMVVMDNDIKIFDTRTGKEIKKHVQKIEWNIEQASKGDFEHFMIKEICEQNESILKAISHPDEKIRDIAKQINDAFGVFFVACGSSYHAGLTASYIFSKVAKKHINVVLASEFPYYEHFLTKKTLLIPISQSGETADVLQAVKTAKKKGVKIISIVNVMGSTLMRNSDDYILMNAGPEICVLSTKTYTSELAILILLAYACVGKLKEGKALLEKTSREIKRITSEETRKKLRALAERLKKKEHMFVIGRGVNYPSALEGALKIKEVSYIHAEAFAAGESKHGPIAMVEKDFPIIALIPNDETKEEMIGNVMEMRARGGYIIGISPENNGIFEYYIDVSELEDANAILDVIPIQILAYYLAVLRGFSPDYPRNLAKSVTVR